MRRLLGLLTASILAASPALAQYSSSGIATPVSPANGGSGAANSGNLTWNAAQTLSFTASQTMTFPAASDTLAGLATAQTFSQANTFSKAGAASTPGVSITGVPFAGTGTTSFAILDVNANTATASSTLNTNGTMLRINQHGSSGTPIEVQIDGAEKAKFDGFGNLTTPSIIATSITTILTANTNAILSYHGAANWQLGATDAAAPVAQILSVQSVIAGTSNTAGVDWTRRGSAGTGTGAGGKIIEQVAPAGTTGTSQNGFQTVQTIDSNQHVKYSSAAIPTIGTCGGGTPTVTAGSTDVAGSFTTGTTATACTLTFKIAYTTAPFCVAQDITATVRLLSYTVSTTAIVATMTSNSGDVVHYICYGN